MPDWSGDQGVRKLIQIQFSTQQTERRVGLLHMQRKESPCLNKVSVKRPKKRIFAP